MIESQYYNRSSHLHTDVDSSLSADDGGVEWRERCDVECCEVLLREVARVRAARGRLAHNVVAHTVGEKKNGEKKNEKQFEFLNEK